MSIMMPALGKAKKVAQAAVCMSNLHQFGVACKMYTQDNKGRMPPREERFDWWADLLPYYLNKKLLICPSAKKTQLPIEQGDDQWGKKFYAWVAWGGEDEDELYVGSYGINLYVGQNADGGRAGKLWGKLDIVKGAAYIPVLSDSAMDEDSPRPTDAPPPYDGAIYGSGGGDNEMWDRCINRHNEAINILFADWHVERVGLKGLWGLWWYPNWPQALEDAGGPPDFCAVTAEYDGWMCHMKDYAPD